MVELRSVPFPTRGGGADGPTWRTDDDPGATPARAVDHSDRAADRARSQDGAQICRARHRGAGLRASVGWPAKQARPVHGISARASGCLSRSQRGAPDPRDSGARLRPRLYAVKALPGNDPAREWPEALRATV